jgi:hypothetical protein
LVPGLSEIGEASQSEPKDYVDLDVDAHDQQDIVYVVDNHDS